MVDKKLRAKRVGRGLDAIFKMEDIQLKDNEPVFKINEWEIEISKIKPNPNQPRTLFDDEALTELSESIKSLGVIQPITVCKEEDDTYTIISGERRYRASKLAGLQVIPAYIRTVKGADNLLEMALVENIQRSDLSVLEVAFTLQRLIEECKITQEELADRVGKKRSTVSNYIRLLKLPAEIQSALRDEVISMGHARAILSLESTKKQCSVLKKVIKNALSVRQTEMLIKAIKEQANAETIKENDDYELPESYIKLVEHLEKYFTQDISIKKGKNGEGKIVINFKDDTDIHNILSKFELISK
ncbi:MAG: ParB/RepB/Spo0J family partition protein [Rikenellaceae bacterium]